MNNNFKFVDENDIVYAPLKDAKEGETFFDRKPSGFVEDTRDGKKYKFWNIEDGNGNVLKVAEIDLENVVLLPDGGFDLMDEEIVFYTDTEDTIKMVISMIGCYNS